MSEVVILTPKPPLLRDCVIFATKLKMRSTFWYIAVAMREKGNSYQKVIEMILSDEENNIYILKNSKETVLHGEFFYWSYFKRNESSFSRKSAFMISPVFYICACWYIPGYPVFYIYLFKMCILLIPQFYIVFGHVFHSMYGLYFTAIWWFHFIVLHILSMFYLAFGCTRQALTKQRMSI